jgi:thiol:disulfide interchange protein DsbD
MNMIWRIAILMVGMLSAINESFAQNFDPVDWSYEMVSIGDNEYELRFTAVIDEGWTVYSQYIEEGGPVPTTIYYENGEIVELLGEAKEFGYKKEGMDPIFEMEVVKFLANEPYEIVQRIKVLDAEESLRGYLTYMTCDDERCLPPTDIEFTFSFSGDDGGSGGGNELPVDGSVEEVVSGNVIDQTRPMIKQTYKDPIKSCGEESEDEKGMLGMFIFGFLGGLLALLTPCVFPMIPLTVSFFTKDTKRKGWWNGTIYGISIIIIYVSIGLLITLLFGEEALNRLSTNWIANSLFFAIFVLFAFSFFGFYELTLPSSWSNKSDRMADKGGLIGIFFMAFTLAIVSFSCTGPIIGTAIVQAATNQIGPLIVMTGFSLALALPFGLFAAFPAWLNSLPKSGGWMNSVKVVLGFLELALAFKFLSVADMTNHWGILKYELFLGIWVLVAIGMALYGFGIIKFPHDNPTVRMTAGRWVYSLGSVALALYLSTGFMYKDETNSYNSLKLLSGLAPPSQYNFFLPEPSVDPNLKDTYSSLSKCANNIDCFKDYYEGLAYAKKENKPILLDHTGYGCVNCRKTEEHIWVDDRVREKLSEDFVLVSLYVDDDKKLEEVLVSKTRNKKMRNVGNKWADFQIVNFEQNSQPLYVMITPDEEVIAPPRGYKEGVGDYLEYLECGLEAFDALTAR